MVNHKGLFGKSNLGESFNLSYLINSDGKSHHTLWAITHMFSKLLGNYMLGLGESFNKLSINSDSKSQSYNSKYSILSHNVFKLKVIIMKKVMATNTFMKWYNVNGTGLQIAKDILASEEWP